MDCPTRCWKQHDRVFICLDTIPEREGRTDGQTEYSTLHCEQCGRAVEIVIFHNIFKIKILKFAILDLWAYQNRLGLLQQSSGWYSSILSWSAIEDALWCRKILSTRPIRFNPWMFPLVANSSAHSLSNCAWRCTDVVVHLSAPAYRPYLPELWKCVNADVRTQSSNRCDVVIQRTKTSSENGHLSSLDRQPGTVYRILFATLREQFRNCV